MRRAAGGVGRPPLEVAGTEPRAPQLGLPGFGGRLLLSPTFRSYSTAPTGEGARAAGIRCRRCRAGRRRLHVVAQEAGSSREAYALADFVLVLQSPALLDEELSLLS